MRRGFRQAASYHTEKLIKAPVGHFFDVMTNGFGAMPSYASRVEPDDRWRIAAYIRVLQLSQNATLEDVPADQRSQIDKGPVTPPITARSCTMTAADSAIERRSGNGSEGRCWWALPARCWRSPAFFWTASSSCAPISSAICTGSGWRLGCLGILLMHHTVGGKWGMMIRRMCEAGARTLPYMIILLIPVLLNLPTLYPWARPEAAHDANLVAKSAYLNVPGVLARTVFYFVVWALYAYLLSKWSAEQDRTGDERLIEQNAPRSARRDWWCSPS